MKNQNNKISRKKFLDLWKNYNEFEFINISISEEVLDDSIRMLNVKGHIKAYMKQNKINNNDKLDLIINKINDMQIQINNLNTKVDNGFRDVNLRIDKLEKRIDKLEKRMDKLEYRINALEKRMDKLELCPIIANELSKLS